MAGHVTGSARRPCVAQVVARDAHDASLPTRTAWSTTDGAYELPLPEGSWIVHAERGAQAGVPSQVHLYATEDGTYEVDLELGVTVWGYVLDPWHAPVEGATVSSHYDFEHVGDSTETGVFSGSDGRYRLIIDPDDAVVSADAPDFAPAVAPIQLRGSEEVHMDLHLIEGAVVSGRVTDRSGATVRLTNPEGTDAHWVEAAEEPRYAFDVDWKGTCALTATVVRPGLTRAAAALVEVGSGEPRPTSLRLGSTPSVGGRVQEGPSGVSHASVTVRSARWGEFTAVTDAEGRFAVEGLPEGEYEVVLGGVSRRVVVGGGTERPYIELDASGR